MPQFPRRSLLTVLLPVIALSFSACALPTEPQVAEESVPRRQNLACVGATGSGELVVLTPVNGQCPSGFDLQPWW